MIFPYMDFFFSHFSCFPEPVGTLIRADKFGQTVYRNDPKFSDRYAWANSADPDQTAPRGEV